MRFIELQITNSISIKGQNLQLNKGYKVQDLTMTKPTEY